MKDIFKYGLILGFICFLASAVLSAVNAVTAPKIQMQQEKEEQDALKSLIPNASEFRPYTKADKLEYYAAYENGRLCGFVIKGKARGYSSDIEALAALDLKLEITDVRILSANETPGLGSRVKDNSFLGQFKNKSLQSLDKIQAITGATISSRAVIKAVESKLSEVTADLNGAMKNAR